MHIGVGSGNPVKREAAAAAFAEADVMVESIPVESGVADQPFGERETIQGAKNRARTVLDAGDYDFGVGIEGGVAEIPGEDGLFLIMWAAVTDGDRLALGAGPRLPLPDAIARRVRDGEELGAVMDDVLDTDDVAKTQGAAGALTGNRIDRQDALRHAVAGALGSFVTALY